MITLGFKTEQTFVVRPSGLMLRCFCVLTLLIFVIAFAGLFLISGWIGKSLSVLLGLYSGICCCLLVCLIWEGSSGRVWPRVNVPKQFLSFLLLGFSSSLVGDRVFRFSEGRWTCYSGAPGFKPALSLLRSGPALVMPWLVIVPFTIEGPVRTGRLRKFVTILKPEVVLVALPDSCAAESLRRLRVLLRWHSVG